MVLSVLFSCCLLCFRCFVCFGRTFCLLSQMKKWKQWKLKLSVCSSNFQRASRAGVHWILVNACALPHLWDCVILGSNAVDCVTSSQCNGSLMCVVRKMDVWCYWVCILICFISLSASVVLWRPTSSLGDIQTWLINWLCWSAMWVGWLVLGLNCAVVLCT